MRPAVRREVAGHLQVTYGISERRACQATGSGRSSQRYRTRSDPQVALRMRLKELAAARVRYGYRRLHVLLRREGWIVNHKRTYRLYRDEGLSIRPKLPKRKRAWRYRQGRPAIGGPNEVWAMDFVSDGLFDGRPFRILTVVDCHTREALSLTPRATFRAFQVVEVCFSIGLGLTMVSAGVLAALSVKHVASRWSGFSSFARQAPYASAALIVLVGLYTGWLGWQGIQHGLAAHAAKATTLHNS